MQEEQKGRVSNELATVLSQISVACKQIASLVCRAGIADMTGVAGLQNISGEDQKKLDVISNEVFSNCLRSSGRTVRPCGRSSSVHAAGGQAILHCACGEDLWWCILYGREVSPQAHLHGGVFLATVGVPCMTSVDTWWVLSACWQPPMHQVCRCQRKELCPNTLLVFLQWPWTAASRALCRLWSCLFRL